MSSLQCSSYQFAKTLIRCLSHCRKITKLESSKVSANKIKILISLIWIPHHLTYFPHEWVHGILLMSNNGVFKSTIWEFWFYLSTPFQQVWKLPFFLGWLYMYFRRAGFVHHFARAPGNNIEKTHSKIPGGFLTILNSWVQVNSVKSWNWLNPANCPDMVSENYSPIQDRLVFSSVVFCPMLSRPM